MHIEPGYITTAKIAAANLGALSVVGYYSRNLLKQPANLLRTGLAALFFSLFMQSLHMNVGPSELHFIGAMAIYLTLGFIPTLLGFAAGLLLQGMLFSPADLMHLGVNALSLIVPLIGVHYTLGRRLREGSAVSWSAILKLDALYYSGVVVMVGFWLAIGEVATPFAAWAAFAASYLAVVAVEPFVTFGAVQLLKRYGHTRLVSNCFAVAELKLAR